MPRSPLPEAAAEVAALRRRIAESAPRRGWRPPDDAAVRFATLPLSARTLAGLAAGGFETLKPIQRAAIPHALADRDVLGAARTGSGKTLAFLVPAVEALYRERWAREDGLGALVVSPTRELALQIFGVLRVVGARHAFSAGLITGGRTRDWAAEQARVVRASLLVATPGRALQHLEETPGLDAGRLQALVVDEADRVVDLGFAPQLDAIATYLPAAGGAPARGRARGGGGGDRRADARRARAAPRRLRPRGQARPPLRVRPRARREQDARVREHVRAGAVPPRGAPRRAARRAARRPPRQAEPGEARRRLPRVRGALRRRRPRRDRRRGARPRRPRRRLGRAARRARGRGRVRPPRRPGGAERAAGRRAARRRAARARPRRRGARGGGAARRRRPGRPPARAFGPRACRRARRVAALHAGADAAALPLAAYARSLGLPTAPRVALPRSPAAAADARERAHVAKNANRKLARLKAQIAAAKPRAPATAARAGAAEDDGPLVRARAGASAAAAAALARAAAAPPPPRARAKRLRRDAAGTSTAAAPPTRFADDGRAVVPAATAFAAAAPPRTGPALAHASDEFVARVRERLRLTAAGDRAAERNRRQEKKRRRQ